MIVPDAHTRKAIYEMVRYDWELTWNLWPKKCNLSGARIPMFSKVYKGTRSISGPGTDLVLTQWATPQAYMFNELKGRY